MYILCVTFWLKGVVGGFDLLVSLGRFQNSHPFSFPDPFETFVTSKLRPPPKPYWRGVDGSTPMLCVKKGRRAIRTSDVHTSLTSVMYSTNYFKNVFVGFLFLTYRARATETFTKRFNLWK